MVESWKREQHQALNSLDSGRRRACSTTSFYLPAESPGSKIRRMDCVVSTQDISVSQLLNSSRRGSYVLLSEDGRRGGRGSQRGLSPGGYTRRQKLGLIGKSVSLNPSSLRDEEDVANDSQFFRKLFENFCCIIPWYYTSLQCPLSRFKFYEVIITLRGA